MKRLVFILFTLLFFIISCGKENDNCTANITNHLGLDIHYNKIFCSGVQNFEWKFDSYQEYQSTQCSPNVPVELGFNGIVLAQGVKLPYISANENINPAYELEVQLFLDSCKKNIDFTFILTNVDTFERFVHNRNVIVLLNGIDSTYNVNFSHEIIPYNE